MNPTAIFGPALTTRLSSSPLLIKAMLDGTMTVAPRARFGVADVRDIADLPVRAMAAPDAAGKRFLALADGPASSFVEVAAILRDNFGATLAPTEETPGPDLPRPVIHDGRTRTEPGRQPRPVEATIVETAQSLRDLGLLDQSAG